MLNLIFQFGLEPILMQRLLIGSEAILETDQMIQYYF